MSDDVEPGAAPPREILPLGRKTTRAEEVDLDLPRPEGATREIRGLEAASTRTEAADPEDATPLVVVDEEAEPASDAAEAPLAGGALLGELKSLRSRNQILRTERTAIAGRKYALEVVIESLREKLEAVARLCDEIDAPGEVGAALAQIREALGDARRLADSKAVLAADLEEERAKHLEERQAAEQRRYELEETVAGLRAERDALREQVGQLERERRDHLELVEVLQGRLDERDQAVAAVEQQADVRTQELEAELEGLRASVAALELQSGQLQAARAEGEAAERALAEARDAATALEAERDELRERLAASEQERDQVAAALETARSEAAGLEAASAAKAGEAQSELEALRAKAAEQKAALVELKPMLEHLDKEVQRLGRLVGEARARGRVDVKELMARAAMLRRLEKLTSD